jgi:hypothetical protein
VENYEEMERGEGGGDVEPDYPNKVKNIFCIIYLL